MWLGFFTHTRRPARRRIELLVGYFDQQRGRQVALEALQRVAQSVGLLLVAGEAVQQEAVPGVAVGHALGDHAHDHLVRHQVAGVHVALGLASQLGAVGHLRAQDVAG